MSPHEFKTRYLELLPRVPPELDLKIDEFMVFPRALVEKLNISESDKAILAVSGLPRDVSPFLTFGSEPEGIAEQIGEACGSPGEFSQFRMIGQNGSGDMICINEDAHGSVVYLNHDRNMDVVFMNSSVTALAQSLCAFAAFMRNRDANACEEVIRAFDPAAMAPHCFWPQEINGRTR